MSKRCESTSGHVAAPMLVAALLLFLAQACGPQTVPLPPYRGHSGGQAAIGTGTAGGTPTTAGTNGGVAGVSGRAPTAGSGAAGKPPTTTAGSGAAGTTGVAGGAGVAGKLPDTTGGAAGKMGTVEFDAGSDPDRNRVMPGGLCTRLATIQCAAEAHCCTSPRRSVEDCVRALGSECNDTLYLDDIAANSITGWNEDATYASFTEFEERSARCDVGVAEWLISPQGLRGILKGTRGPGDNCKPSTAGLREKTEQAAALASCSQSETTACLPSSLLGAWTCAGRNSVGGGCATEYNCSPGLYCSVPGDTLGKCADRLSLNAACKSGSDCESLYCKGGHCVEATIQVAFCLE